MSTPRAPSPASDNEKRADEKLELGLTGGVQVVPAISAGYSLDGQDGPSTTEDIKETKRILRKLDLRVLPICSILYLFSFLDRSSIGNAKVAGMDKALGLTADQYATALSVFFVLYCFFEVPSNLMLKKYGAKLWLPCIMLVWGLIMLLTGFVKSYEGLVAARFFLGLAEAGLFPGVTYLLTTMYPRRFIQLRVGVFFSAATIAGAFGGLLSYGLSFDKTGAYEGWSWIFFVLGALTMFFAIVAYFSLFNGIENAKFLSSEEKNYIGDRIKYDGFAVALNDAFAWKFVWAGLLDWKTWLSLFIYWGSLTPIYSIALTLPSILRTTLGYDPIKAQLLTVPVYCVAAVTVVVFAWLSDRYQNRTVCILAGTGLSAIGWGMGYGSYNANIRYAATFISAAGAYAGFPSVIAVLTNNVGGKTKRSVCIAVQVGIGGLAGIISSNIFLAADAPHYDPAYLINIGMNCLAFVAALLNAILLKMANKRKQAKIDSGEAALMTQQEIADAGDSSPFFKYTI